MLKFPWNRNATSCPVSLTLYILFCRCFHKVSMTNLMEQIHPGARGRERSIGLSLMNLLFSISKIPVSTVLHSQFSPLADHLKWLHVRYGQSVSFWSVCCKLLGMRALEQKCISYLPGSKIIHRESNRKASSAKKHLLNSLQSWTQFRHIYVKGRFTNLLLVLRQCKHFIQKEMLAKWANIFVQYMV